MSTLNFGDFGKNVETLGKDLFNGLTTGLLSHVTDPVAIDAISRATATLAASPLAAIGADEAGQLQAKEDYNSALTVLLSYASADVESAAEAAAEAAAKLKSFVADSLQFAISTAVKALLVA